MNFDITPEKQAAYDALETESIKAVREAIGRGGDLDGSEKAAVKVLGVVAKNRVTATAREALGFSMASLIGKPEEMERYIAVTNPQVRKALSA